MPGENVQDWSRTAASNANADSSIGLAEGMARAAMNDSVRSMMAGIAKWRDLLNGSRICGGTANAQTFTSGMSYTSIPTNLVVLLKHTSTNTTSMSLNMDGIGANTVKNVEGNDLSGGEAIAGGYGTYVYNGTNFVWLGQAPADPPADPDRVLLAAETSLPATAAFVLTSFPTGAAAIDLAVTALQPSTAGVNVVLQFSQDTGATYVTSGYAYTRVANIAGGSVVDSSSTGDSSIFLCGGIAGTATTDMVLRIVLGTSRSVVSMSNQVVTNGSLTGVNGVGSLATSANAIKVSLSGGQFSSGKYIAWADIG